MTVRPTSKAPAVATLEISSRPEDHPTVALEPFFTSASGFGDEQASLIRLPDGKSPPSDAEREGSSRSPRTTALQVEVTSRTKAGSLPSSYLEALASSSIANFRLG